MTKDLLPIGLTQGDVTVIAECEQIRSLLRNKSIKLHLIYGLNYDNVLLLIAATLFHIHTLRQK